MLVGVGAMEEKGGGGVGKGYASPKMCKLLPRGKRCCCMRETEKACCRRYGTVKGGGGEKQVGRTVGTRWMNMNARRMRALPPPLL